MAKDKKNKNSASMPNTGEFPRTNPGAQGMNPNNVGGMGAGMQPGMMSHPNMAFSYPGTMAPPPPATGKKGKKKKGKGADLPPTGIPNTAGLSPEQLNQLQLEEAIKESQNPSLKLKKLRSPISVRGCLLNILLFVFLTLVFVFLYIWIFGVQEFRLFFIAKDILDDFGISKFFREFFTKLGNFFSGKGWTLSAWF